MRTTSRRPIILALAFITLLAAGLGSYGQDVLLLHMTNTNWRYYQAGNQPPNQGTGGVITWRATNYTDSTWATGPGCFGVEPDALPAGTAIRTSLVLSNAGAPSNTITYYFRTTFNYGQNPVGSLLTFTNLLDDGAVVYLNGTEIYRYRITGTPAYNTIAGNQANERVFEINDIVSSPSLRQGQNTLAVEVHQASLTSSDVLFGLALRGSRAEPIVITNHPQDQVLAVGEDLNLSVGATGTSPVYQWFKNGVAIAGANSSTFQIRNVTTAASGNYWAVVSNAFSRATSEVAVVTVVADTFSPIPLTAIVEENETNRVTVTFDDTIINSFATNSPHIFRAATNEANYKVQILGEPNTPITVTSASANTRLVRLNVSPNWDRTKEYYITFYNIADDRTNAVRRGEQIGINFRVNTNIMHENVEWSWTGQFQSNMPPSWTSLNYPEDPAEGWAVNGGPLYFEPDGNDVTCMGPIYNGVGNGSTIANFYPSYYFRKKFVVSTNYNLAETTMRLTHILDDGAVFYLNGAEIFRTNLPAGPLSFDTVALASWEVSTQNCRSNSFPGSLLRHGTNILAVQLHQGPNPDAESYDVCMGMRIDFSTTVGFDIPRLTVNRLPPLAAGQLPRVRLSWPGTGWTLQQSSTPFNTNSWSNVTGAAPNAHTNNTTASSLFFRLRKQ